MFLILRRLRRDIVVNVRTFSRYSCRILMKLELSLQIFKPSCSMRMDVQTDRHDEANTCFSQFCERAYKVY